MPCSCMYNNEGTNSAMKFCSWHCPKCHLHSIFVHKSVACGKKQINKCGCTNYTKTGTQISSTLSQCVHHITISVMHFSHVDMQLRIDQQNDHLWTAHKWQSSKIGQQCRLFWLHFWFNGHEKSEALVAFQYQKWIGWEASEKHWLEQNFAAFWVEQNSPCILCQFFKKILWLTQKILCFALNQFCLPLYLKILPKIVLVLDVSIAKVQKSEFWTVFKNPKFFNILCSVWCSLCQSAIFTCCYAVALEIACRMQESLILQCKSHEKFTTWIKNESQQKCFSQSNFHVFDKTQILTSQCCISKQCTDSFLCDLRQACFWFQKSIFVYTQLKTSWTQCKMFLLKLNQSLQNKPLNSKK